MRKRTRPNGPIVAGSQCKLGAWGQENNSARLCAGAGLGQMVTTLSDEDAAEQAPHGFRDEARAYGDPRAVALRWKVPPEFVGTRADVYLSIKVGRLSRQRARRIIERGDFRRGESALKPSSKMHADEVVLWRIPPDDPGALHSPPRVIFEDERLLVVNKPADLAVHPSARYLYQTLTHWLAQRASVGQRPASPCHRLDRETSGVLACAQTRSVDSEIKRLFQSGQVRKTYLAVVRGELTAAHRVDQPLALQGERGLVRIRMIADPAGAEAITDVQPLFSAGDRTLVACYPQTGRQHQIRAHLALLGYPIVGDKLYAMGDRYFDRFTVHGVQKGDGLEHHRHALHAYALELKLAHEEERFIAPFPEDLFALLPKLRAHPLGARLAAGAPLGGPNDDAGLACQTPQTQTSLGKPPHFHS